MACGFSRCPTMTMKASSLRPMCCHLRPMCSQCTRQRRTQGTQRPAGRAHLVMKGCWLHPMCCHLRPMCSQCARQRWTRWTKGTATDRAPGWRQGASVRLASSPPKAAVADADADLTLTDAEARLFASEFRHFVQRQAHTPGQWPPREQSSPCPPQALHEQSSTRGRLPKVPQIRRARPEVVSCFENSSSNLRSLLTVADLRLPELPF